MQKFNCWNIPLYDNKIAAPSVYIENEANESENELQT